jgi:hypothetical protein
LGLVNPATAPRGVDMTWIVVLALIAVALAALVLLGLGAMK